MLLLAGKIATLFNNHLHKLAGKKMSQAEQMYSMVMHRETDTQDDQEYINCTSTEITISNKLTHDYM